MEKFALWTILVLLWIAMAKWGASMLRLLAQDWLSWLMVLHNPDSDLPYVGISCVLMYIPLIQLVFFNGGLLPLLICMLLSLLAYILVATTFVGRRLEGDMLDYATVVRTYMHNQFPVLGFFIVGVLYRYSQSIVAILELG